MKVIKVTPRGYCKGVVRAINIAKEARLKYPLEKITILGMLVHNKYVMDALKQLKIDMVDDKQLNREQLLDKITEGIVIFTAHGIDSKVKNKAIEKGLKYIDASCPDVVKTQKLVKSYLSNHYTIFYIGKKFHPEAEAICQMNNQIYLIENENDIPNHIKTDIFVTNQTTMSIFDVQNIFHSIKEKYPNAIIAEEICNATRIRQEAVATLDKNTIDALFVVGDPNSNNTNRLAQIGKEKGIQNVIQINTVLDIDTKQLQQFQTVAVTSGASTPTYLTNQVIDYLENHKQNSTLPKICIDKIL